MTKNNKNVQIEARQVTVTPNKINKAKSRNNANRTGKQRKQQQVVAEYNKIAKSVPTGVQTGLSMLSASVGHGDGRDCFADAEPFSDQAKEFIENFCDPCGEHCSSLDAARVPDGALQTSAGGFFRAVNTIVFPWQTASETDLTGHTYSMLFLQLPLFRSLTFILARRFDGEFSEAVMNQFAIAFANLASPDTAFYPEWIDFSGDGSGFFTAIDTHALRNILTPADTGASGAIDSYRLTSQGMNVMFNVPDLVNQGTFTAMRYPTNKSTKVLEVEALLAGSQVMYLSGQADASVTDTALTLNLPNAPAFPPSFTGPLSSLPTLGVFASVAYRNASGSFIVGIGHNIRYNVIGANVVLENTTNGNIITIVQLPLVAGSATSGSVRFYETSLPAVSPEDVINVELTNIVLPPVMQDDMMQQNPKVTASLAKDTNGCYLVSAIFEPVFRVAHSTDYRKVLLTTKTTDLNRVIDPHIGWFDTVDENFGLAVINFQGIPYACKPLVKLNRSVEIVPSSGSLIGAFTTGCPPVQSEAVDVCKAFADNQPHGYPVNWNGLGILFGKILQVTEAIPTMLRTGMNISRQVKQICDHEVMEMPGGAASSLLASGLKRLMRIG